MSNLPAVFLITTLLFLKSQQTEQTKETKLLLFLLQGQQWKSLQSKKWESKGCQQWWSQEWESSSCGSCSSSRGRGPLLSRFAITISSSTLCKKHFNTLNFFNTKKINFLGKYSKKLTNNLISKKKYTVNTKAYRHPIAIVKSRNLSFTSL